MALPPRLIRCVSRKQRLPAPSPERTSRGGRLRVAPRCRYHHALAHAVDWRGIIRLMQADTFQIVEIAFPWSLSDGTSRAGIACIPALADADRTEVDVLSMRLVVETRCEQ